MPKGHSLLEPRIAALEARSAAQDIKLSQIAKQLDAVRHAPAIEFDVPNYEPLFSKWPINGGS
jgi:hypothetical protein